MSLRTKPGSSWTECGCSHQQLLNRRSNEYSAELTKPRKLVRIRPGIFDFKPNLGLKLGQTKPQISATAPIKRHTTIPNDSGPISKRFDDNPKLLNCAIAQPSILATNHVIKKHESTMQGTLKL